MALSRNEKAAVITAIVLVDAAILAGSVLFVGDLSWSGFFTAVIVALFATAAVGAVVPFYSAYHRHIPKGASEPVYHEPAEEEGAAAPFESLTAAAPDERPRP